MLDEPTVPVPFMAKILSAAAAKRRVAVTARMVAENRILTLSLLVVCLFEVCGLSDDGELVQLN